MEDALPRLLTFINKRLDGGKQWLVGDKVGLILTLHFIIQLLQDFKLKYLDQFAIKVHKLHNTDWVINLLIQISLADIMAAQFLTDHMEQSDQISNDQVASALCKRVTEQPSIKKWLEVRPTSKF